jgi:hypothetical protein
VEPRVFFCLYTLSSFIFGHTRKCRSLFSLGLAPGSLFKEFASLRLTQLNHMSHKVEMYKLLNHGQNSFISLNVLCSVLYMLLIGHHRWYFLTKTFFPHRCLFTYYLYFRSHFKYTF